MAEKRRNGHEGDKNKRKKLWENWEIKGKLNFPIFPNFYFPKY